MGPLSYLCFLLTETLLSGDKLYSVELEGEGKGTDMFLCFSQLVRHLGISEQLEMSERLENDRQVLCFIWAIGQIQKFSTVWESAFSFQIYTRLLLLKEQMVPGRGNL
jgi:hypothetical protein